MTAFDKAAEWVADKVATAWFFSCCVALVVLWAPSYVLIGSVDTWQLVINTATTIITFLLVALLHNTQHRFEQRTEARMRLIMAALDVEDPFPEHSGASAHP